MADIISEYKDKVPPKLIEEVRSSISKGISDTKLRKIMETVYEEYKDARVHAGESVGLIAAESIGEPGTQMSLDYEEKVIVKNQNKIRVVKIGEFIDKIMNAKANYMRYIGTEICDLSSAELFVPALSQNEKVEWKKVTALSRHKSTEKLLRLKTKSGRQIIATPCHSFVTRKDNQIVSIAGSNLKIGDRIPAVRKMNNLVNNEFAKLENYLPKSEYIYESELRKAVNKQSNSELPIKSYEQINNYAQGNNRFQLKQNCVYMSANRSRMRGSQDSLANSRISEHAQKLKVFDMYQNHGESQIPEVLELNGLFGFFIGAYLAEGTHTEHYIAITNNSEEYLHQVIQFAEKYNIGYKIKYGFGEYGKSTSLILNSTLIADLLKKTCGKGAYGKYVPEFAYSAKLEFIRALLMAYFDGDGSISVMRKVVRASSCSEQLIDGIVMLLSQFGIFATKSAASKNQHTLSISYRYAREFKEKIGSAIPIKRNALEKLNEMPVFKISYDSIDMIPGYGDIFSRLGKKLNVPARLTNKFTKKQKIGRQTLKKYTALFEKNARELNVLIDKELKILKRMLDSDVVWDEIVGMDYIKPTNGYVYDFSVEDLETFTTFEGIVTHNTLNTFHFAGVAEMNVTLGLPRIIEILDGRKELENPMMEIYLKKPYSTGKKIEELRQLALQIKETKLKDIATEFSINIADFVIEVKLNKEKMKEIEVTNSKVADAISKQLKGYNIRDNKETIVLKARSKDDSLNEAYKTKEKIKNITIKGIKGISQVMPVKREEEFVIITAGSNLADVLQIEEVDSYRTTTNNIFEIEHVLGIEAARQAIINEIFKVIEIQGLNVDVRHIMLVADTMCFSGSVKGITRYGVVSEKSSVLARASFETPIKHIINAALVGEVDNLNSVVENVMINQPVPLGTGLPKLYVKAQNAAKEK